MRSTVLFLFAVLVTSSALAFPNEPTGYRDIEWNTPFARHQMEMRPVTDGDAAQADFYTRKGDPLTLGGVKLYSLSYAYQKERFVGVVFRTEGASNETAIIDYLRGEHGPGKRSGSAGAVNFEWTGPTGHIELHCQSHAMCVGVIMAGKAYAAYKSAEAKQAVEQRPPRRPN